MVNAVSPKFMKVKISTGGTATVDRSYEVKGIKWTTDDADNDSLTLGSAADDAKDFTCEITALQDMTVGSLWDLATTSAGSTATVLYQPFGNTAASVSQPHWSATVTIGMPDGDYLGGDASTSATAKLNVTLNWSSTKPVRVTS